MKSLIMTALVAVTLGPLSSVNACMGAPKIEGQPTPKCMGVGVAQAMSYRRFFNGKLKEYNTGLTVAKLLILKGDQIQGEVAEKCTKDVVVSVERSNGSVVVYNSNSQNPRSLVQCLFID